MPGFLPAAGPRAPLSLHAALCVCWLEKPACVEMRPLAPWCQPPTLWATHFQMGPEGRAVHPPTSHHTDTVSDPPAPESKGFPWPPAQESGLGWGCLPCVPGGARPAASEASSLDAQTDRMRGRHAHTQGADWRQLWPWAQARGAHQEPSPGWPERHPDGWRVTNRPSPCGAGTGRGLVAWDARGRVEAACCLRVRACDWAHLPVCECL